MILQKISEHIHIIYLTLKTKAMKKIICLVIAVALSNAVRSQIWYNPAPGNPTSNSDLTYRAGDVKIDGSYHVGPVGSGMKINSNQICIENTSTDLYINNAAAGNGNVWLGKPWGGTITALSDFHGNADIYSNGNVHVGTELKITGNQICVESTTNDMYINNAAAGTGNVWLGKTWGGTVTALSDMFVTGKLIVGNPLLSTSPHFNSAKFSVKGKIVGMEVVVTQQYWSDFVFDKSYKLRPLTEVESFYNANHHLPEVPSAAEIAENGNDLGKTDAILLQKIEELTLYIVKQEKRIQELEKKAKGN
jgi:hypothetical protein